ncbi:unnamed protein product [Vitrella brassicaformis CCMP3155]|uniref:subtilisin n=1 Tax=Vitrella brassicaformis (strain CCMP3155) TaxID=1169540 RepID=A0A0G4FUE7_VITBC|nr:unnamed protein product [Vitrella brassicaformis CCMP3155]|eukprot:CEM18358.1 unnamed protein product [Vitrella brassicaformis CCMP3155]
MREARQPPEPCPSAHASSDSDSAQPRKRRRRFIRRWLMWGWATLSLCMVLEGSRIAHALSADFMISEGRGRGLSSAAGYTHGYEGLGGVLHAGPRVLDVLLPIAAAMDKVLSLPFVVIQMALPLTAVEAAPAPTRGRGRKEENTIILAFKDDDGKGERRRLGAEDRRAARRAFWQRFSSTILPSALSQSPDEGGDADVPPSRALGALLPPGELLDRLTLPLKSLLRQEGDGEDANIESDYLSALNMEVLTFPTPAPEDDRPGPFPLPLDRLLAKLRADPLVESASHDEVLAMDGGWKEQAETEGQSEESIGRVEGEWEKRTELSASLATADLPNDPDVLKQWAHMDSRGVGLKTPEAWSIWTGVPQASEDDMYTYDTNKQIVAVLDSGVQYDHLDLADNMWRNEAECNGKRGIDDDHNGFIDDCHGYDFVGNTGRPYDDNGHGTHTAGVIAAIPNNRRGVVGVCWRCKIMAVKVLDKDINGAISWTIKALNYAILHGAKITNNSWGGQGTRYPALEVALNRARQNDMVFIAAAGNYNSDNDVVPTYPASYPVDNILSVAAMTQTGKLLPNSNWGHSSVHLAAPGERIYSTWLDGGYRWQDGTSCAVPYVSGVVALVWGREPMLGSQEVIDRVIQTTTKVPALIGIVRTSGTVNALAALEAGKPLPKDLTSLDCASKNPCSKFATCWETENGPKCMCAQGYRGSGFACADIDECADAEAEEKLLCGSSSESADGPPSPSVCRNTAGAYECVCQEGYEKDGQGKCRDIDECSIEGDAGDPNMWHRRLGADDERETSCPAGLPCINTQGGFRCQCPSQSAWVAEERTCSPIGLPSSGPCVSNGPCGAFAICQVAGAFLWERAECACMDGFIKKTQTATECHPVDSLSPAVKVQGDGEDLAFPPLQLAAMASGSQEDTNSDHSSDVFFSLPKAKAEEDQRQRSWGSLGSSSTPPQPAVGPRSAVDILSDTPAPFVFQQAKKEPQQDAPSLGGSNKTKTKTKTPPNKPKNKPPHQKQKQQQQQQQGPGKQKAKAPGPMAMAKKEKENNRMASKWQQAAEAAMAAKRRRRSGGGVMTATTAALSQAADGPLLNLGRLVAGGLPTGLMGGRG